MILPGKHLNFDRALLTIGSEILAVMGETSTVSELWECVRALRSRRESASPLPFDWRGGRLDRDTVSVSISGASAG